MAKIEIDEGEAEFIKTAVHVYVQKIGLPIAGQADYIARMIDAAFRPVDRPKEQASE